MENSFRFGEAGETGSRVEEVQLAEALSILMQNSKLFSLADARISLLGLPGLINLESLNAIHAIQDTIIIL